MRFNFDDLRALIYEALINAYSVLGLEKNATEDEIKKAYRTKALEFHPDRNVGNDTTASMVQVNVAKDILSNPLKRRQLDNELSAVGVPNKSSYQRPSDTYNPEDYYQRPKPPPVQNGVKHYYVKKLKNSNKYWWHQKNGSTVNIGSSTGETYQRTFYTDKQAWRWLYEKIKAKTSSGYKIIPGEPPSQEQSKKRTSSDSPKTTKSEPNSSYKIYKGTGTPGKTVVGRSAIHTRIKGRVYMPTGTSKFSPGDKGSISFDDKDNIKVKNDNTGHTQSWKAESIDSIIDDVLIEVLFKNSRINIM